MQWSSRQQPSAGKLPESATLLYELQPCTFRSAGELCKHGVNTCCRPSICVQSESRLPGGASAREPHTCTSSSASQDYRLLSVAGSRGSNICTSGSASQQHRLLSVAGRPGSTTGSFSRLLLWSTPGSPGESFSQIDSAMLSLILVFRIPISWSAARDSPQLSVCGLLPAHPVCHVGSCHVLNFPGYSGQANTCLRPALMKFLQIALRPHPISVHSMSTAFSQRLFWDLNLISAFAKVCRTVQCQSNTAAL